MRLDQYLITVVRKQENVSAKQALLETNVMLALQDTGIAWKPMLVMTMTKCNNSWFHQNALKYKYLMYYILYIVYTS